MSAYFIFFISLFGIFYPQEIEILKSDLWTSSVFIFPKFAIIYMLTIWMFISILEKKHFVTSIIVSIAAVSYVVVAPSIFLSLSSFFLFLSLKRKNNIRVFFINLTPLFVTGLYFIFFYGIYGKESSTSISLNEFIQSSSSFIWLKTGVNIFIKTSLQILVTTSPYLVLIFYLRKQIFIIKDIYIYTILTIIFSLITWVVMHTMHDSVQLWSNIYLPMINILFFSLIILGLFFEQKKKILIFLFVIILLFLNEQTTNVSPIVSVKKYNYITSIIQQQQPRYVFLKEEEEYVNFFDKAEMVYKGKTQTLARIHKPFIIACLSSFEIPIENENEKKFNDNLIFNRYINNLKKEHSFIGYCEAQNSFVTEFNIDYVLVSKKRKLPKCFNKLFNSSKIGVIDGYNIFKRIECQK